MNQMIKSGSKKEWSPADHDSSTIVTQWSSKANEIWYCHCCGFKNKYEVLKCKVCGRPESYALSGYHLPFHGENCALYRPSQLVNVMEDIHEVDSEKWTSLHSACALGNVDIVKQLLSYKAQIEAITERGHTPLHLAVYSGSIECVAELLRKNANVNVATFTELITPLHMSCEKGFAKITQMLIHNRANIHAVNLLGRTPLHCAAMAGRSDIALLLLRSGALLHAMDYHGWEACQIAELMGHREIQELLIREGMTEKQAVMKDLPPAKWHSEIWHEVVRMQTMKKRDFQQEIARAEEEQLRIKQLQVEVRRKAIADEKFNSDRKTSNALSTTSTNSDKSSKVLSSISSGFKYRDKDLKFFV